MKRVPKSLLKEWSIIGGLSSPSKMPCFSFSTPAKECKTGSKLRKVKGTVCSRCYAFRGYYQMPNVRNALAKRYANLYHPEWVAAMTTLIGNMESSGYMRFFDSGDIDSLLNLENINQVALNLPHIKFWVPSKEYQIVSDFIKKHGKFAPNLFVRLSAYIEDGPPPTQLAERFNLTTSTVVSDGTHTCPASNQDNFCLNCRACWNPEVKNVAYKKH